MEDEDVILVVLEIHTVELGLDVESLSLGSGESSYSNLLEHSGAIPIDVIQF